MFLVLFSSFLKRYKQVRVQHTQNVQASISKMSPQLIQRFVGFCIFFNLVHQFEEENKLSSVTKPDSVLVRVAASRNSLSQHLEV